jgi:hypothetical protein
VAKSNVVQESGIFFLKTTPKQENSICVQHSKPGKFQITIPTWIKQFPSFISSQLLACELAICVIALSIKKFLHSV